MAEIKDVYSLEFNSSQFQSEIDSAIARIEELNSAMADGADVADELASAQGSLVDVLGTEAKGVEQLNQKRNVLVNTQKNLNKETQSSVAVGKQLDTTNKQLAVSTGQAAAQQRGLGQTLVSGTRQIGQMRRVVSTLGFAFRAIGAVLPFGLILSFASPIIGFFQNLVGASNQSAKNMEKLADSTLPLAERLDIATTEIERLNQIEAQRGYLTDEEQKKRRELVETYKQTSEQIIKEEQDRFFRLRGMQIDAERIRIKLQGESVEQIKKAAELEAVAIDLANKKQMDDAYKRYNEGLRERDRLLALNLGKQAQEQEIIAKKAGQELDAIRQLQNQQLLQNEADRDKSINEFLKRAEEKRKQDRLDAIRKELKDTEDLLRFRILATEEGSKERYQAELNLINTLEELRIKYANELEISQNELLVLEQENIDKREEAHTKYFDNLAKKRVEDVESFSKMLKAYEDELEKEINILDGASKYRTDLAETNLNIDLLNLEKERNQKLLFAFGNVQAQEKIDAEYNLKRKMLEDKANKEIIKIRIDFLKKIRDASILDPGKTAALNKEISDLELKFEEVNKSILDNTTNAFKGVKDETTKTVKDTSDKQKELLEQTANLIQGVSDNVFNVLNAQVEAYISGLDKAIDKSKSALDEIRANSENYNAQQLEIEKERLEKLENERAKAVEREKALGLIQLSINSAIAISKAAAEGGAAAPFTIALTLASLIAGFAQARVASGNAFFHGVEYLERGNNKAGRDTIPAMLNEGERVITTDTNSRYWDVLSAVHNNRIPAEVLNSFANAYQSGGLKAALGAFGENVSLSSELGNKSIFVNVAQTYQGMENRLERIEAVLTDLPKYMPRTVVSANANGIFKIVEQRQRRKNFSSNWSK
jgi:RecA/RadA recombinase